MIIKRMAPVTFAKGLSISVSYVVSTMRKNHLTNQGFTVVEAIIIIVMLAVIGGAGYYIYHRNHKANASSSQTDSTVTTNKSQGSTTTETTPPASEPNPYAGWKTYTLPEDKTVSFKYPADWTVAGNSKDTTTTPYNQSFKIVSPDTYHTNNFVFIFRYSPTQVNTLTQVCGNGGIYTNIVQSQDVTVGNDKLKIVTNAGSIDNIKVINQALVDSSNCVVHVPSGVITATGQLGVESAPTYSIDLGTWDAQPEAKTLDLIFKSIKFN